MGEEARRGAEGGGGAEGETGLLGQEGQDWGTLVFFWTGLLRFASLRAACGRLSSFGRLQDGQDLQDGGRRMEGCKEGEWDLAGVVGDWGGRDPPPRGFSERNDLDLTL